jgi:hypothetical protein
MSTLFFGFVTFCATRSLCATVFFLSFLPMMDKRARDDGSTAAQKFRGMDQMEINITTMSDLASVRWFNGDRQSFAYAWIGLTLCQFT